MFERPVCTRRFWRRKTTRHHVLQETKHKAKGRESARMVSFHPFLSSWFPSVLSLIVSIWPLCHGWDCWVWSTISVDQICRHYYNRLQTFTWYYSTIWVACDPVFIGVLPPPKTSLCGPFRTVPSVLNLHISLDFEPVWGLSNKTLWNHTYNCGYVMMCDITFYHDIMWLKH